MMACTMRSILGDKAIKGRAGPRESAPFTPEPRHQRAGLCPQGRKPPIWGRKARPYGEYWLMVSGRRRADGAAFDRLFGR